MSYEQNTLFQDDAEYAAFLQKFETKKTTDDCYTPPEIFAVVKKWACARYGIDPEKIVRPFYPGGDYRSFDYSGGRVVLDNPPFSILSEICGFYLDNNIPFFLFGPSLTAFGGSSVCMRMNHIICDADITYENGATVRTAFVTSFGGDLIAESAPDLGWEITRMNDLLQSLCKKTLPKYEYPDHVLTAAMLQKYAKYGICFSVRRGECFRISALDSQKQEGKSVFGSGLLLSDAKAAEKAAAEKAAAEKAAAVVWPLSEKEKNLIKKLGNANDSGSQVSEGKDDDGQICCL